MHKDPLETAWQLLQIGFKLHVSSVHKFRDPSQGSVKHSLNSALLCVCVAIGLFVPLPIERN